MSLKNTAGTLAKIIALLSVAYIPQAHADMTNDLGPLTAPTSVDFYDNTILTGSFTDTFNFYLTSGAMATAGSSAISFSWTSALASPNELGAKLTGIELDYGSHKQLGTITETAPIYDNDQGLFGYKYTGVIADTSLAANTNYSIVINGTGGVYNTDTSIPVDPSLNIYGSYSGSLTLTAEAPPVPEPEQWAMLLIGLPLIGMVSRRKQGNRLNAAFA